MRGSKKLSVVTKPNENTIQTQQYRQTDGQTDMFFISIPKKAEAARSFLVGWMDGWVGSSYQPSPRWSSVDWRDCLCVDLHRVSEKSSTSYFAEYIRAGLTDCKNFNGYRVRDNQ